MSSGVYNKPAAIKFKINFGAVYERPNGVLKIFQNFVRIKTALAYNYIREFYHIYNGGFKRETAFSAVNDYIRYSVAPKIGRASCRERV